MFFGTFGKISSKVQDFVNRAVNYRAEHLGKSMAASTFDMVRQAIKRSHRAHLLMASWRGYANLILDRAKYVGDGSEGLNMDQLKLGMVERADQGEFESLFLAHETDMSKGDSFLGR